MNYVYFFSYLILYPRIMRIFPLYDQSYELCVFVSYLILFPRIMCIFFLSDFISTDYVYFPHYLTPSYVLYIFIFPI